MKKNKLNNGWFLVLGFSIYLLGFPLFSKAQNDTISDAFKSNFKKNLNELNDLYCWQNESFYPGKINFNSIDNLETEFQNLKFPFFSEFNILTPKFYYLIEGSDSKKELIRYFSFYEKEMETIIEAHNLPIQLKYLAPALSAMNPKAVNGNGKSGVWQLTHFQAVLNGLQVNNLVDERFLIENATIATVQELKQNFTQFDTPEMAIAAFILGKTKVKNAIQKAGAQTENPDILKLLPNTLNEQIAAFQAIAIYLNANVFVETVEPLAERVLADTVLVNKQLHFKQVSSVLGIKQEQIQYMNPQYKYSIIPTNNEHSNLLLPNGKWDDFELWQDSIYNSYDSTLFQVITQKIEYPPSPNRANAREPVKDLEIEGKTKIQYRLKTGDVLGIIAENYDVRVADLKYWNNIYNERKIQAGKKLDIFVDDDKADYYLSLATPEKKKSQPKSMAAEIQKASALKVFEDLSSAKKVEHIVQNGESPYLIAKKYDGVTPDEILEWNNIDDARKIQIGQKLTLYLE